jgi:hypothetical protein
VVVVLRTPGRDGTPGSVLGSLSVAVLAAAALAAFGLVHYPGLRSGSLWILYASAFAVGLIGYAVLGWQVGRLGTGRAHRAALVCAAPALPCGWWIAGDDGVHSYGLYLLLAVLPVVAAWWVVRRERDPGHGFAAAVQTALLAGLFFFLGFVATSYARGTAAPSAADLHRYATSGIDGLRAWAIGDSLGGACFMLIAIPLTGLCLAAVFCSLLARHGPRSTG